MAGLPGSPASLMPAGPDEIPRQIKDLRRDLTELGPSVARSVAGIVADLQAQVAATAAATAAVAAVQITLTAQVADIAAASAAATAASAATAATVADLASRVTVTATIATFSTPSLPNDNTLHEYGADIPITIAVPTGKLTVTVGCGGARSVGIGGGTLCAEATFSISGTIINYGNVYADADVASPTTFSGTSLCVQQAFTLSPGTYTITGKMRASAAGTAAGRVDFYNPYLTVQVTG